MKFARFDWDDVEHRAQIKMLELRKKHPEASPEELMSLLFPAGDHERIDHADRDRDS